MSSRQRSIQIAFEEFAIRVVTLDYLFIKKILRKEFRITSQDRILDIGSGTGILSPYFPPHQYMGIDIDADLIRFSKRRHSQHKFQYMDAGDLTFPHNSFTKALLVGSIHHIKDATVLNMFKHLGRVLKKGSIILAIEPIPSQRHNIFGRFLRARDKGHHIRKYRDYLKLMKKHFVIERTYKQNAGLVDYGVFILTVS